MDKHGELTLSRRVVNDRDAFRELLGDPEDAHVALEATNGWEWLAELLEETGYDVHLAHPLRTRAIAAARVKTDAIDARTLAHLLRTGLLPEASIAPPERWALTEAAQRIPTGGGPLRAQFERIAKRRGRKIAKVAIARQILTLCYYDLRDGEIRCLARQDAEELGDDELAVAWSFRVFQELAPSLAQGGRSGELAPVSDLLPAFEQDGRRLDRAPEHRTTLWSAPRDRMDDWSLLPSRSAVGEPAPTPTRPMSNPKLPARLTRQ